MAIAAADVSTQQISLVSGQYVRVPFPLPSMSYPPPASSSEGQRIKLRPISMGDQ